MATIGSIKIRIGGDISSLERSLKRAERSLQRSGRKLTEMGSRLSAAITLPVLAIGAAALKTAGDYDSFEKGMESMMGTAGAARAEIALLRKEALKPGLNFKQALKGSVRLQAVKVDSELARRALVGFGNAIALVGGTGQQLDGVTLALSQIAAKGKISAEEINQIAERVPQIRQILKDGFGTADTEEIQKLGIGFEEFITTAIVELEKLPKAQSGIKNSIENTQLALEEAGAVIGKKLFPIFEKIANVVVKLATAFGNLPDGLQTNIIQFALLAAVAGPVLSVFGSMKILAGTLAGTMASLSASTATLFVLQGNGLPIGKALSIVFKSLGVASLFLGTSISTAMNPMGALFGALSRLNLAFSVVATKSTFLAGGAIRQLGRSFLFLAKAPIPLVSIGLAKLSRRLVGFGNGLIITSVLNNKTSFSFATLQKSLVGTGNAFKGLGAKIAFVAKNPFKALRLGLLAIGGALSSVTIPFGLIAIALAAFGAAVVANIGPARKKFVELANTFIDLYNESTAFRGVVETISFTLKTLYAVGKAVLGFLATGFKAVGKAIIALFKGDIDGIRKAITGGFGNLKEIGEKAGKEIAAAFNTSYDNTFGDKPPLAFITEKDVEDNINKAAAIAQGIQEKLFGITTPEIDTSAFADLTGKTFGRNAKVSGGSKKEKEETPDTHQFDRIFGQDAADINTQTSLLPEGLQEHIEKVNELGAVYDRMRERFSETVDKFNEGFASIIDNGIQDTLIGIGDTLGNVLSGSASGISLLGTVLESFAGIMIQVGKLAITTGLAIEGIRKSLQTLNPVAAIAGGVALVALGTFVKGKAKSLGQPKLAKGGLAYGETLATVGDNFNAAVDPEVIAPLSKLQDILSSTMQNLMPQNNFDFDTKALRANLQPAGGNITLDGEFRILGTDLILAVDKAKQQNYRTTF